MALGITPFELNASVGRTQDFSIMKAAEDSKVNVDQMNFAANVEQNVEQKATSVSQQDDTGDANNDSANRNPYGGDGGRNRKKKSDIPAQGRVLVKKPGGFDISI